MAVADLATEMRKVKHPFDEGHQARKGPGLLAPWSTRPSSCHCSKRSSTRYERASSQLPERPVRFMTTSSQPIERLYTPADFPEDEYLEKLGFPGQLAVYPRRPRHRPPRQAVDHAHVRRLRQRRRDQRALQIPAGQRQRRPVGRLRHAHAVRLRHRRSASRRRVRHVRRGGLVAGRHGGPVRRHPARRRSPRR